MNDETARTLVEKAEAGCLVAVSLDLPIEATLDLRVPLGVRSQ